MKNYYQLFKMSEKEIEENPFMTAAGAAGFYRFIVEKVLKIPYEKVQSIDCRKINTATNIQESWFKYARENEIPKENLAMAILMSGPKSPEYLEENYVELEAGAIEY